MSESTNIKLNTVKKTKQRCKNKMPTLKNLEVLKAGKSETEIFAIKSIKAYSFYCSKEVQQEILKAVGA